MKKTYTVCAAVAGLVLLAATAVAYAQTLSATLTLDPQGAKGLGYYPVQIALSEEKTAGVLKEPTYKAKPK